MKKWLMNFLGLKNARSPENAPRQRHYLYFPNKLSRTGASQELGEGNVLRWKLMQERIRPKQLDERHPAQHLDESNSLNWNLIYEPSGSPSPPVALDRNLITEKILDVQGLCNYVNKNSRSMLPEAAPDLQDAPDDTSKSVQAALLQNLWTKCHDELDAIHDILDNSTQSPETETIILPIVRHCHAAMLHLIHSTSYDVMTEDYHFTVSKALCNISDIVYATQNTAILLPEPLEELHIFNTLSNLQGTLRLLTYSIAKSTIVRHNCLKEFLLSCINTATSLSRLVNTRGISDDDKLIVAYIAKFGIKLVSVAIETGAIPNFQAYQANTSIRQALGQPNSIVAITAAKLFILSSDRYASLDGQAVCEVSDIELVQTYLFECKSLIEEIFYKCSNFHDSADNSVRKIMITLSNTILFLNRAINSCYNDVEGFSQTHIVIAQLKTVCEHLGYCNGVLDHDKHGEILILLNKAAISAQRCLEKSKHSVLSSYAAHPVPIFPGGTQPKDKQQNSVPVKVTALQKMFSNYVQKSTSSKSVRFHLRKSSLRKKTSVAEKDVFKHQPFTSKHGILAKTSQLPKKVSIGNTYRHMHDQEQRNPYDTQVLQMYEKENFSLAVRGSKQFLQPESRAQGQDSISVHVVEAHKNMHDSSLEEDISSYHSTFQKNLVELDIAIELLCNNTRKSKEDTIHAAQHAIQDCTSSGIHAPSSSGKTQDFYCNERARAIVKAARDSIGAFTVGRTPCIGHDPCAVFDDSLEQEDVESLSSSSGETVIYVKKQDLETQTSQGSIDISDKSNSTSEEKAATSDKAMIQASDAISHTPQHVTLQLTDTFIMEHNITPEDSTNKAITSKSIA
ncbi:hypothetical protein [Anaplasma phagocytophilum]|uniref:hypothetical protein n=1 Tax=Anaplasma phagocytophilum TaxID=948 RepID=UPI00200C1A20|nr:hypothetical protein [Anaplasma phagocytophilum]UQD54587.1 hypothetical protein ESP60_04725 [Anaplasma phagocytophilum]